MDAEVQAFKDKMTEKSVTKQDSLIALQSNTIDSLTHSNSLKSLDVELQKMADDYVAAHPDQFVNVMGHLSPEGQETIVKLIDIFYQAGMEEEVLKLTMFELSKFERQLIGAAPQAVLRLGNGG